MTKLNYITCNFLLIFIEILSVILGLSPIPTAIILSVFFGPTLLFVLLSLLISIPIGLSFLLTSIEEHQVLVCDYHHEKKLQEMYTKYYEEE